MATRDDYDGYVGDDTDIDASESTQFADYDTERAGASHPGSKRAEFDDYDSADYDNDAYEGFAGRDRDRPSDLDAEHGELATEHATSEIHDPGEDRGAEHGATSATGQLMDALAQYRSASNPLSPVRGDPESRDVDDMDAQLAALEPAIDSVLNAWAPEGSPLAEVRQELHFGIVNMLYKQAAGLHRDMNHDAMYLRDMLNITTDSEVTDQQVMEKTERVVRLYDHVGAFERLHSAAAYHYLRRTGETWRPHTKRDYNGTQEDYRGAFSSGRAALNAARDARRPLVYAGIGSRETPPEALAVMTDMADELARHGAVLRSGAARGADQAFERGANAAAGLKEIYLPEEGFSRRSSDEAGVTADIPEKAFEIAARIHPAWHKLDNRGCRLQARNVMQVLGADCESPADVVICWTPDGRDRGGTSQAIRLAREHNIPILNLGASERVPTAADAISHVRRTVPHWRLPRALAAETAETATVPPARTVFPDAHHILVAGDAEYGEPNAEEAARLRAIDERIRALETAPSIPREQADAQIAELRNEGAAIERTAAARMNTISDTLEKIRAKHPSVVISALHGTPIGKFAVEWAELHGVRHQTIGIPRPGDLLDTMPQAAPTGSPSELLRAGALERHHAPIARRQQAIRKLNPRGIVTFGEHTSQTQPIQQVAHNHQIPLIAFDRDGQSTAYRAGEVPAPQEPVEARLPTYAGIGATNAPAEARELMRALATELAGQDFLLRSGGAQGSEEAFEAGAVAAQGQRRVYLPADGLPTGPWRGTQPDAAESTFPIPERAYEFAAARHDNWEGLAENTRRQYARNAVEILGDDLATPTDFVVCWTRDGNDTGVTAQALEIAREHNIPVINLGAPDAPGSVEEVMDRLGPLVSPTYEKADVSHDATEDHDVSRDAPAPEYTRTETGAITHSAASLRHAHRHFDRVLEVLGPDATQLADYRAKVAWGLTNVVHYHHARLESSVKYSVGKNPNYEKSDEYATLKPILDELAGLERSTRRHYSEGLGYGAWSAPSRKVAAGENYARTQARSILNRIDRSATEAHHPANARVIVEGAERLPDADYDRLDGFLNRLRARYLDTEQRDITIVSRELRKNDSDILRRWCENNGVHQYVHHADFDRFPEETKYKDAPTARDMEMVNALPPDRYIHIRTPGMKTYIRRHVENFNAQATAAGEPTIKITEKDATTPAPERAVSAPAPIEQTRDAQASTTPEVAPAPTVERPAAAVFPEGPRAAPNNIVSIDPANNPLRFYSKSEGAAATLSNFASEPIRVDGVEWPTVEHYYQSEKLGAVRTNEAESFWSTIRQAKHPAETKSLGRSLPAVQDWDDRKVGVMAEAVAAKFQPGTEAAQALLSTGKRPLVHHEPWGRDGTNGLPLPFWGADEHGNGDNVLGRMLEHCRDQLRAERTPSIDSLAQALPDLGITDPAEDRAIDYLKGLDHYDKSYQAWAQSYRVPDTAVHEEHSARTNAIGEALGRAAKHFNANYARYKPHLDALEITHDSIKKRERTLDITTSHSRAQSQQHERSAMHA